MKGMLKGVVALALTTALFASTAQAQGARFGIAANGAFSLEEGGGSEFGASALAEFGGSADSPIGFRADVSYFFDPELLQGTINVLYTFTTSEGSKFHPYLIGGGGYITDTSFDDGDFLVAAGAGFNIMMENSSIMPFVEGRFINQFASFLGESTSLQSVQAMAGVKFGTN